MNFTNPALIRDWIMSFGRLGILVFLILQIIQVVIFFIPGEFIQVTGGYLFGLFWGTLLSSLGILIGSIITFLVGRIFGEHVLKRIIKEKDYIRFEKLINRPNNKLILFISYLIPGMPKDILGYISGITTIKIRDFIILTTIARIPGILISSYLGSNLYHRDYKLFVVCVMVAVLLLTVITKNKDRILDFFK